VPDYRVERSSFAQYGGYQEWYQGPPDLEAAYARYKHDPDTGLTWPSQDYDRRVRWTHIIDPSRIPNEQQRKKPNEDSTQPMTWGEILIRCQRAALEFSGTVLGVLLQSLSIRRARKDCKKYNNGQCTWGGAAPSHVLRTPCWMHALEMWTGFVSWLTSLSCCGLWCLR
jgi:hypothetical protein